MNDHIKSGYGLHKFRIEETIAMPEKKDFEEKARENGKECKSSEEGLK